MKGLILLVFALGSFAASAAGSSSSSQRVGLEIRGTYGFWQQPKDLNSAYTDIIPQWPTQPQPKVMGGDLLYEPDKVPLVFGVRYETFSQTSSTWAGPFAAPGVTITNISTKLKASRTAVLIGGRQNFDSGFVGLLASVGVVQKADFTIDADVTPGGHGSTDNTGNTSMSYSAGVEGAYRAGVFEIGAEAGYLSFKVKSFTDPNSGNHLTSNNTDIGADFSGLYAKGFIGFAF